MSMPKAMFTSNRDDWETPNDLFSKLNDEFHFDLDAAASPSNAKVSRFFTKRDDALTQDWGGVYRVLQPALWRRCQQVDRKSLSGIVEAEYNRCLACGITDGHESVSRIHTRARRNKVHSRSAQVQPRRRKTRHRPISRIDRDLRKPCKSRHHTQLLRRKK